MDIRAVLGRNVRQARARAGLTQDELASRTRVHVTYLSGIENGRRNATVEVLSRLATALDVPETELVRRE